MRSPSLELWISGLAGDPWRASVTPHFEEVVGTAIPICKLGDDAQRREVRWYVEQFSGFPEGGHVPRARQAETILKQWGKELGHWIFADEGLARRWLQAVQLAGRGTLEIVAEDNASGPALVLPWELARLDSSDASQPLHSLGVSVVRRPRFLGRPQVVAGCDGPVRALLVVCRPSSEGFLDSRYTARALIDLSESDSGFQVEVLRPPTFSAMEDRLLEAREAGKPFRILHFDGHGTTLAGSENAGALCFETDQGGLDLVRADRFARACSASAIDLAFLEACNSADDLSGQDSLTSALVREGISAVVAMGYAVHVDMTRLLTSSFYEALAGGAPVAEALLAARQKIDGRRFRRIAASPGAGEVTVADWFIPQLYQGAGEPAPWRHSPGTPWAVRPQWLAGLFPPPRAGFQGREREILALERRILANPVVTLYGIAGVGKTALAREATIWWTRSGLFGTALSLSCAGSSSSASLLRSSAAVLGDLGERGEDIFATVRRLRPLILWDDLEPPSAEAAHSEISALASDFVTAGARLLITARGRLLMPLAIPFELCPLDESDGVALLAALTRSPSGESPHSTGHLRAMVRAVGGHPLALELAATTMDRIEGLPAWQVREQVASLSQTHDEPRNRSLRASLESRLATLSREAREALPALALLESGVEWIAAQAAGLPANRWEAARAEIVAAGLASFKGEVLSPHPFLAAVLGTIADTQTVQRFLNAAASLGLTYIQWATSIVPEEVQSAMRNSEPALRRAVELALESGHPERASVLAHPFRAFLEREGRAGEAADLLISIHQRAGAAADPSTLLGAQIVFEGAYGLAYRDPEGAREVLRRLVAALERGTDWDSRHALESARALLRKVSLPASDAPRGDPALEAEKLLEEGRPREAAGAADLAVELAEADGNASELARILCLQADVLLALGDRDGAGATLRRAAEFAVVTEDEQALASVRLSEAHLFLLEERLAEALEAAHQSVNAFRLARDTRGEIKALNALGHGDRARGEPSLAVAWFEDASRLAEQIRDFGLATFSRGNRALALVEAAEKTATPEERRRLLESALRDQREALTAWVRMGRKGDTAKAHLNLSQVLLRLERFEEAERHARRSLDVFEETDQFSLAAVAAGVLEAIARRTGEPRDVERWRSRQAVAEARARGVELEAKVPLPMARILLSACLELRRTGGPPELALTLVGFNLPDLFAVEPGLARNALALANDGAERPKARVHPAYQPLVDEFWEALASGRDPREML